MNRQEFQNQLEQHGYFRHGVRRNYTTGTINCYVNRYIPSIERNIDNRRIYNNTSIRDLENIRDQFLNKPLNQKTIANYISALNRYIDFIRD